MDSIGAALGWRGWCCFLLLLLLEDNVVETLFSASPWASKLSPRAAALLLVFVFLLDGCFFLKYFRSDDKILVAPPIHMGEISSGNALEELSDGMTIVLGMGVIFLGSFCFLLLRACRGGSGVEQVAPDPAAGSAGRTGGGSNGLEGAAAAFFFGCDG